VADLLNKSPRLALTLIVTKFTKLIAQFGHTIVLLKSDLDVQQTHIRSGKVESGFACKHKTSLERLAKNKNSGLLRKSTNYGRKKFCNIGPWMNGESFGSPSLALKNGDLTSG
jgi:hypothetical protein